MNAVAHTEKATQSQKLAYTSLSLQYINLFVKVPIYAEQLCCVNGFISSLR